MHWGPSSTENVNPNTVAAGSVKRPSQAMVSQLSSGHRISQDGLLQSATLGEWEKSQRIDPTAAQASWAYQISAVWAWELSARFSAFSSPDCPKYLLARGFLGTQINLFPPDYSSRSCCTTWKARRLTAYPIEFT
jgi:hypothetical protein